MGDFAIARTNMVESQIRPNGVTDRRIIDAMASLPREKFVPDNLRTLAYMDDDIPLAASAGGRPGRFLMAPMPLGRLIQLAGVQPGDLVLDVGCATGYSTAILARLAESVVGLECDAQLAESAGATLVELGVDNTAIVAGPLEAGYASEGPFDVILLGGSVPEVPGALLAQLKEGGRLVAVVASGANGRALVYTRIRSDLSHRAAFEAGACPLPGFERPAAFVF
ncbi:MAG: protein-L-isoaspartate O-methyltransferase [Pseudomonadota bacterium]|nr:protein-L-isoaspartate O-methyltransferase [Pseudomonadota bacterium]